MSALPTPEISVVMTPKAFVGADRTLQRVAIESWHRAGAEVLLFGDDRGTAEVCEDVGCVHVPDVTRSSSGRPMLDEVMLRGQERATNDIVVFVNADIAVVGDVRGALVNIAARMPSFLAVAPRREVTVPGDDAQVMLTVSDLGDLRGVTGPASAIDFFAFPRGQLTTFPPFVVGRPGWDNWMIYHHRERRIPIVEIGEAVRLLHLDHRPGYASGKVTDGIHPEAQSNLALAAWATHFSLDDVTHVLRAGLVLRTRRRSLRSEVLQRTKFDPTTRRLAAPFRAIVRRFRSEAVPGPPPST